MDKKESGVGRTSRATAGYKIRIVDAKRRERTQSPARVTRLAYDIDGAETPRGETGTGLDRLTRKRQFGAWETK